MSGGLGLALLLALSSAVALNWGFYRQHEQASALPPLSLRHPFGSLLMLFANPRWLAGFLVGIVGWILYVAALAFGPLSLVQAVSAGGIGVLALLVSRLSDVRLARREWIGVWISISGLVLLGVSLLGRGGNAHHWGHQAEWWAVAGWMLTSAAVAGLFAGPLQRVLAPGAGLGIGAGFLYAAGDVATKAAVGGGARLAFVPALLAAHGFAFALLQLGFQRGAALATAGVATLFTNAVPIVAGMVLFHEPMPAGALGVARVLAFACVVSGAVLLTRPSSVAPAATIGDARGRSSAKAAHRTARGGARGGLQRVRPG